MIKKLYKYQTKIMNILCPIYAISFLFIFSLLAFLLWFLFGIIGFAFEVHRIQSFLLWKQLFFSYQPFFAYRWQEIYIGKNVYQSASGFQIVILNLNSLFSLLVFAWEEMRRSNQEKRQVHCFSLLIQSMDNYLPSSRGLLNNTDDSVTYKCKQNFRGH